MKYIDPITKEKKTIYTKASDTLPLGAIVDFDGEEIPAGWEPAPEDATVYIGPNEPTDRQDIWIQKGKNMIDPSQFIYNTTLVSDGTTKYQENYIVTPFIPVKPNTTYAMTGFLDSKGDTANNYAAFYDKNHNFISGEDTKGVFTVAENVAYVRFNSGTTNMDISKIQVEIGDHITEFEPYINKKIYIKNEAGSYDLFVKSRVHTGLYQPEDGEEVWMNKSKNLFTDGLVYAKSNCNISDGVVTQQNADTNTHLYWKVQSFSGVNFVADILHIEKNDTGKLSIPFTKKSTFNRINLGLNGSQVDTVIYMEVGHLKNDVQYVISCEITNVTQGSVSWKNIQIEEGNEATSFEPYVNPRLQVKNNAGGYEDFFKPIQLGVTKSPVVKYGDIEVIRTGNIVIVEVCDIELTEERAEWNTCIAEGLPKPMLLPVPGIWRKGVLADESKGIISVDSGGNLSISTRTGKQPTNKTYNGQFIYVTRD